MATEHIEPEAIVEENQPAEAGIDYEVALQVEQEKNAKLERDLGSIRGELRTQKDRDGAFVDQLNALGAKVTALGRAQQTGESEQVFNEMSQIDQRSAASQASRNFVGQANTVSEQFAAALKSPDGAQYMDINAPELVDALRVFHDGWSGTASEAERLTLMNDSVRMAHAVVNGHLYRETVEAQKSTREAAQEQRLQEGDLDTGTALVSGQRDDRYWWDNVAPNMPMTPENLKRAREVQTKIERGEL